MGWVPTMGTELRFASEKQEADAATLLEWEPEKLWMLLRTELLRKVRQTSRKVNRRIQNLLDSEARKFGDADHASTRS
jgi:hypothetical protein